MYDQLTIDGEPPAPPPRGGPERRWWLALVVVGVLVLGVSQLNRHRHADQPVASPSESSASSATADRTPLPLGAGTARSLLFESPALYVLMDQPSRIIALVPGGIAASQGGSSPTYEAQLPDGSSHLMAYDLHTSQLWSVTNVGSSRSILAQYDPLSLTKLEELQLPFEVNSFTAFDAQLWFGTRQGLFWTPVGPSFSPGGGSSRPQRSLAPADQLSHPTEVGNYSGVSVVVASPTQDRVLIVAGTGGPAPPQSGLGDEFEVVSFDAYTSKVTAHRSFAGLTGVSMAPTQNGLWLAGYGSASQPRVLRLDDDTLAPFAPPALNAAVGPGARLWPGNQSVWIVSDRSVSEGPTLRCADQAQGRIQASWGGLVGPAVSADSGAFAVDGSGAVVQLRLTGTPCYQG